METVTYNVYINPAFVGNELRPTEEVIDPLACRIIDGCLVFDFGPNIQQVYAAGVWTHYVESVDDGN